MPKSVTRTSPQTTTTKSTSYDKTAPNNLKPYLFNGVDLEWSPNDKEAKGTCPFCGKEEKFYVNIEKGQWTCFTCGGEEEKGGGGVFGFFRHFLDVCVEATTPDQYKKFAKERGLEYFETLIQWEVCLNPLTGNWMIPAWGVNYKGKKQLRQLYSYMKTKNRMALIPTPGTNKKYGHELFGLNLYNPNKPDVDLCEGPWDAMRFYEVIKHTKLNQEGLVATSDEKQSMLADSNVLAVPGCNVFHETWRRWFKDKRTTIMYDNDHPKKHPKSSKLIAPAGMEGVKRVVGEICAVTRNLHYLKWGEDGFDANLPSGYDLKDVLKDNAFNGLEEISRRLSTVPEDWAEENNIATKALDCEECDSWKDLIISWKKALRWTTGLDHALAVMLASVSSTQSIGDQLWIKVIGPASCGKSTLCEAVSVNKKYVIAKSTIRGFHSGYVDPEGRDNSLLAAANGKTLVTKDGDTLLQSPNLGQILSEGRDVYDGVSRTSYRNTSSRDYEGQRMTWLLCGTSSLRSIDSSELGERFLDCVIMEKIDEQIEEDILWMVADKAANHVDIESSTEVGSHYSAELTEAMQKTGGYVSYLRENAHQVMSTIEFSKEAKQKCIEFGKFVAFMRARPSIMQTEQEERELAARLVSQHIRLAKCLAYVLGQPAVNKAVLRRVRRVCLDTSRGVVLEVAKLMIEKGDPGLGSPFLQLHTNYQTQRKGGMDQLLAFLKGIGMVQLKMVNKQKKWSLVPQVEKLYRQVVG